MFESTQLDALRDAAQTRTSASHAVELMNDISSLLGDALPHLERLVTEATDGPAPLPEASQQLVLAGGKRVRPITTLLMTSACKGDPKRAVALAAAIELIHSATLLHDDVLDEGEQRRGRPSSRVVWGNLVSVLAGDLLLTSALELVAKTGVPGAMEDVLATMKALIAGEIAQFKARGRDDLGVDGYLEIVEGKTASLFASACRLGARVAGMDANVVDAVGRFGGKVGIAFQIIDDVLDLEGVPHEVGKQLGHDLAEGKTTLPLALALTEDRDLKTLLISARGGDTIAAAKVAQSASVIKACKQARQFAAGQTEAGLAELRVLEPSRERDLLVSLVRGLIDRRA